MKRISAAPLRGFLGSGQQPVALLGKDATLGTALSEIFSRCDVPCIALSRSECDLTRGQDLSWLLRDVRPACVVNCAAITDLEYCERHPGACTEINGNAVGRLAGACRAHVTPLVHVSCASVFDGSSKRRYGVNDLIKPLSQYGQSKALGEALLQRFAPPNWLLVRTSWLYGELKRDFVGRLLSQVSTEKRILAAADQIGSPTFAADLACGFLLLLAAGASGIWHLSNRGVASWYTFAKAVVDARQCSAIVYPSVADEQSIDTRRPKPLSSSVLDCSMTYRRLGVRLRRWESSLKAYITPQRQAN